MRVAQINMVHYGSTGKIMFQIAKAAVENGIMMKTFSTFPASKKWVKLPPALDGHTYYGSRIGNNIHFFLGRLAGGYGFHSRFSTWQLIRKLKAFKPDVLHLHNLHAGYIHLPMLFNYARKTNIQVIWTLHDCWAFTGKCAYFTIANCDKWQHGCHECPQLNTYPVCYIDRTKGFWKKKKRMLTRLKKLTLVTPSQWLADLTKKSFLGEWPIKVINNGIDLSVFKPTQSEFKTKYSCEDKFVILGVAFGWGTRKGLDVFLELSKVLDDRYQIVLVGTDENIKDQLPSNVIAIHRTANQQELAEIYSAADLFINPTREENYPTVNMEALACGTPVLTFRTGGSPEIIDETCGSCVDCDDLQGLINEIERIHDQSPYSKEACLRKAESFDMYCRFKEYVQLYEQCI